MSSLIEVPKAIVMDKFVHKKPRLDLAVSGVGCGAGIASHEPETERSDASEPYMVLPHHVR